MKFTNARAFEKHLAEAAPNHFSPIYFLIGKEAFERREAEKILTKALLAKTSPEHALKIFDAERASVQEILAELGSFSFFSDKRIIVINKAEELDKAATEELEKYFESPSPSTFLIISADAINRATKFYKKGEAAGIILDLPEEKPWEKENTLQAKVIDWAKELGKTIAPDTARYLIQVAGTDAAQLYNELDKILCYTAEKPSVTKQDIDAICIGANTETGWQLGDAIFRRDGAAAMRIAGALMQESGQFFSLVRQIRSQFQTKAHICSLLAQGGGATEVQQKFPYMKGHILQQNMQLAKSYGMEALIQGIIAIDDTELQAKNSSIDVELLTDRLILKLAG